jgi:hypothetical protein
MYSSVSEHTLDSWYISYARDDLIIQSQVQRDRVLPFIAHNPRNRSMKEQICREYSPQELEQILQKKGTDRAAPS